MAQDVGALREAFMRRQGGGGIQQGVGFGGDTGGALERSVRTSLPGFLPERPENEGRRGTPQQQSPVQEALARRVGGEEQQPEVSAQDDEAKLIVQALAKRLASFTPQAPALGQGGSLGLSSPQLPTSL